MKRESSNSLESLVKYHPSLASADAGIGTSEYLPQFTFDRTIKFSIFLALAPISLILLLDFIALTRGPRTHNTNRFLSLGTREEKD